MWQPMLRIGQWIEGAFSPTLDPYFTRWKEEPEERPLYKKFAVGGLVLAGVNGAATIVVVLARLFMGMPYSTARYFYCVLAVVNILLAFSGLWMGKRIKGFYQGAVAVAGGITGLTLIVLLYAGYIEIVVLIEELKKLGITSIWG